jgi:hypothetical protein
VYSNNIDGTWYTTGCDTPLHRRFVCEHLNFNYSGMVAYYVDAADWTAKGSTVIFPDVSVLPANNLELVYGYTVQIPFVMCSELDHFVFKKVSDWTAVFFNQDCMLQMIGRTYMADVRHVLSGLQFHYLDTTRSSISFSYIIWVARELQFISYNQATGHVYPLIEAKTYLSAPSWFTGLGAQEWCSRVGGYLAEIDDEDENIEIRRAQIYGEGLIGGKHNGVLGTPYKLLRNLSLTMPFTDWIPGAPETGHDAVYKLVGGRWKSWRSIDVFPRPLCERDDYNTSLIYMTTITLPTAVMPVMVHTRQRIMSYSGLGFMQIFDKSWDFSLIYDGQVVHGATVHLALAASQCRQDDFIGFIAPYPWWISYQYIGTECSFQLRGTRKAFDYKALLETVYYASPMRSRIQLAFNWIFWIDNRMKSLMMDVEKRTIYSWPTHDSFWYNLEYKMWDESYGVCKILGSNWEMAATTNQNINTLVMMYANNTRLPIAAVRDASGYFVWANGANSTFVNWYVSNPLSLRPTASTLQRCAAADSTLGPYPGKQWTDLACRQANFRSSPCQLVSGTWFSGTVSYLADKATFRFNFTVDQPVGLAMLPPNGTNVLYGATVNMPLQDCKQLDSYFFKVGHDYIYVLYHQDCMLQVAGIQSFTEYNKLMLSLEFFATDTTRPALTFGYVYWVDPMVRDMFVDTVSGHVYTSFGQTVTWTPAASNPTYPAASLCYFYGFYPTEIGSEAEHKSLGHGQLFGETFVGGQRYGSSTTDFQFTTSLGMITYTNWLPGEPSNNLGRNCIMKLVGGPWKMYDCSTYVKEVSCEKDTWDIISTQPQVLTAAAIVEPKLDYIRYINWTQIGGTDFSFYPMNVTQDTVILADSLIGYGMTFQVASHQCLERDYIWHFGSLPEQLGANASAWIMATYYKETCSMYYTGTGNGAIYKTVLANTVFSARNTKRQQLVFGWMYWVDVRVVNMTMNLDTRRIYAVFKVNSAITWDQAFGKCRAIGDDWSIPTVENHQEYNILSRFLYADSAAPDRFALQSVRDWDADFIWGLDALPTFFDWMTAGPKGSNAPVTGTMGNDCAEFSTNHQLSPNYMSSNMYGDTVYEFEKHWNEIPCTTTRFTRIVCQNNLWRQAGQVAWIMPSSSYKYDVMQANFFNATNLPFVNNTDTTEIYGATVTADPLTCKPHLDVIHFSYSHDRVVFGQMDNCLILMYGKTLTSVYNNFMLSATWRTTSTERANLKMGYVFWTDRRIRAMQIDLDTGRVYASFRTQSYWTVPAYDAYPAAKACAPWGMELAELTTRREEETIRYIIQDDEHWLNANYNSSTGKWQWVGTGRSAEVADNAWTGWAPGEPRRINERNYGTKNGCAVRTKGGLWRATWCDRRASAVLCEKPTWDKFAIVNLTLPVTIKLEYNVAHKYRSLWKSTSMSYADSVPIFSSADFNQPFYKTVRWNEALSGITVGISPRQCHASDVFLTDWQHYTPRDPFGVGSYYTMYRFSGYMDTLPCQFRVHFEQYTPFSIAKEMLFSIRHNNVYEDRNSITYSFIFWVSQPSYRRSQHLEWMDFDVETRHTYTAFYYEPDDVQSWTDAHTTCRSLGGNWNLVHVNSRWEQRFVEWHLYDFEFGMGIPLGVMRNGSATYTSLTNEPTQFLYWKTPPAVAEVYGYDYYNSVSTQMSQNCAYLSPTMTDVNTVYTFYSIIGYWYPVFCDQKNFRQVVCETDDLSPFAGSVSLSLNLTVLPQKNVIYAPFTMASLPTVNVERIVYGVTVLVTKRTCGSSDRWEQTQLFDWAGVVFDQDCTLSLRAPARISTYSDWMRALNYRQSIINFDTLRFGFVMWEDRWVQNYIPNLNDRHVWATLPLKTIIAGSPNGTRADTACRQMGPSWYLHEINNMDEWEESKKVRMVGLMSEGEQTHLIGGIKNSMDDITWRSGATLNSSLKLWWSNGPYKQPGVDCMIIWPWHLLELKDCNSFVTNYVACERDDITPDLIGEVTLPTNQVKVRYDWTRPAVWTGNYLYMFRGQNILANYGTPSTTLWGFAVQWNHRKCNSTEYIQTSLSVPFATYQYTSQSCSFNFDGRGTIAAYQPVFDGLYFYSSSNTNRYLVQYAFGFVLQTDSRLQWVRLDMERRVVYINLNTDQYYMPRGRSYININSTSTPYWPDYRPIPPSARESLAACAFLGVDWEMVVPNRRYQYDLIRSRFVGGCSGQKSYWGIRRNATGAYVRAQMSNDPMTFFHWYFSNVGSAECLQNYDTSYMYGCDMDGYQAVNCDTWYDGTGRSSQYVNCETANFDAAGFITFITPPSLVFGSRTMIADPVGSLLPTTSVDRIVYGATLSIPLETCRHMDQFVMTVSNDRVVMVGDQPCLLQLSGGNAIEIYNSVVHGVSFYYTSTERATIKFAYVYWHLAIFNDLVINAHSGNTYAKFEPEARGIYTGNYGMIAADMCTSVGMYLAEPVNESEWREMWRTHQQTQLSWIGLKRPPYWTSYAATTPLEFLYTSFWPADGRNLNGGRTDQTRHENFTAWFPGFPRNWSSMQTASAVTSVSYLWNSYPMAYPGMGYDLDCTVSWDGQWVDWPCQEMVTSTTCMSHTAPISGLIELPSAVPQIPVPKANDTVRIIDVAVDERPLKLIDPRREFEWIHNLTDLAGFSIILSPDACYPSLDKYILGTSPVYTGYSFSQNAMETICGTEVNVYFSDSRGVPAWAWKEALEYLYFTSIGHNDYDRRKSFQFGWVFWTVRPYRADIRRNEHYDHLIFNPLDRMTYSVHTKGVQIRNADQECTSLNPTMTRWRMYTPNSRYTANLISAWSIKWSGNPLTRTGIARYGVLNEPYRAEHGRPLTYQTWDQCMPDCESCHVFNYENDKYYSNFFWTVNLFDQRVAHQGYQTYIYTHICQTDRWEFNGTISFVVPPSNISNSIEIVNPINESIRATWATDVLSNMIYGMSITQPLRDCHRYDQFVFTTSNDRIGRASHRRICLLHLLGVASFEEYHGLLNGLVWRAAYPFRANVTFGMIYFREMYMKEFFADASNGKVLSVVDGFQQFITRPSAPEVCDYVDPGKQRRAEWTSEDAFTELVRTSWHYNRRDFTIGYWRNVTDALPQAFSNASDVKVPRPYESHWYPFLEPKRTQLNYFSVALHRTATISTVYTLNNPTDRGTLCESPAAHPAVRLITQDAPVAPGETHTRNYTYMRVIDSLDTANEFTTEAGQAFFHPFATLPQELTWIPDVTPFYGVTFHVAASSCRAGDRIAINVSLIPYNGIDYSRVFTVRTHDCVVFLKVNGDAAFFKSIFPHVTFNAGADQRVAYSFVWVLWSNPEDLWVTFDTETKHSFAAFNTSWADWYMVYERCAERNRWRKPNSAYMATIDSAEEEWLVTASSDAVPFLLNWTEYNFTTFNLSLSNITTEAIPLGMYKKYPTEYLLYHSRGTPIRYGPWPAPSAEAFSGNSHQPNMGTFEATRRESDKRWTQGSAGSIIYLRYVCEFEEFNEFMGVTNWVVPVERIRGKAYVGNLSQPDTVTDDQQVYGVTVQANIRDCRRGDLFYFTRNDDQITLARHRDCVAQLYGLATGFDYKRFVDGIEFHMADAYRRKIMFATVYWVHYGARFMYFDFTVGSLYTILPHRTSWGATTATSPIRGNPYYPTNLKVTQICSQLMPGGPWKLSTFRDLMSYEDHALGESENARTWIAAHRIPWDPTQNWRNNILLTDRTVSSAAFVWDYLNGTMTAAQNQSTLVPTGLQNWFLESQNSSLCVVLMGGKWKSIDCYTEAEAVSCMLEGGWSQNGTAQYDGRYTAATVKTVETPFAAITSQQRLLPRSGVFYPYNVSNPSINRVPNGTYIYGITFGVSLQQLRAGDRFIFDAMLLNATFNLTNITYDEERCVLYVLGKRRAVVYKDLMSMIGFTRAESVRSQITFTVVMSNHEGEAGVPLVFNPENGKVYRPMLAPVLDYLLSFTVFMNATVNGTNVTIPSGNYTYSWYHVNANASWNMIQEGCTRLMRGWRLPEPVLEHETAYYRLLWNKRLPVGITRNNTGFYTFVYNVYAPYLAFDETHPRTGNNCTELVVKSDNTTVLRTVLCNMSTDVDTGKPIFEGGLCESNRTGYTASFTYVTDSTHLKSTATLQPFSDSELPTGDRARDVAYGVTLSISPHTCRTFDKLAVMVGLDHILLFREDRCALFFSGRAAIAEYNELLIAATLHYQYPYRVNVTASYIYWTHPALHSVNIDVTSGRSYALLSAVTHGRPYALYPFGFESHCVAMGMRAFTNNRQAEAETIRDMSQQKTYYTAAVREIGSTAWKWREMIGYCNISNCSIRPPPNATNGTWSNCSSPNSTDYIVNITEAECLTMQYNYTSYNWTYYIDANLTSTDCALSNDTRYYVMTLKDCLANSSLRCDNCYLMSTRVNVSDNFTIDWMGAKPGTVYNGTNNTLYPTQTEDCIRMEPSGMWSIVPCYEQLRSTMCESEAGSYMGRYSNVTTRQTAELTKPDDWQGRLLTYDANFRFPIFNVSNDLLWTANGTVVYGLTLQLAHSQCQDGDNLTIDTTLLTANMKWTYWPDICVLYIDGVANISAYRSVMATASMTHTHRTRLQQSFSWVFWDAPDKQEMLHDIETRHSYVVRKFTTPVTWEDAMQGCVKLGAEWAPIEVSHQGEYDLFLHHLNRMGTMLPMPLVRNRTGGIEFLSKSVIAFAPWEDNEPFFDVGTFERTCCKCCERYVSGVNITVSVVGNTTINITNPIYSYRMATELPPTNCSMQGFECLVMNDGNCTIDCQSSFDYLSCVDVNPATKQYSTALCRSPMYAAVVCENADYDARGSTSLMVNASLYPSGEVFPYIGILPTFNLTQIVYGATAHTKQSDCFQWDTLMLTKIHDYVTVSEESNCMTQLSGRTTVDVYNQVLAGLRFTRMFTPYNNPEADVQQLQTIRFAYVFWISMNHRKLVMDLTTGHVYTSYTMSAPFYNDFSTPKTYKYHNAVDICFSHNMYLVNTTTKAESLEVLRVQKDAMIIGLRRSLTVLSFASLDGTDVSFSDFSPLQAFDPTDFIFNRCVRMEKGGWWRTMACSTWTPSVGCEANSWPFSGRADVVINNTVREVTSTYRLIDYGTTSRLKVFNTTDFQSAPVNRVIFGMTIQLAVQHCMPGDYFKLDTSLTTQYGITITNYTDICTVFLTGENFVGVYATIVDTVQFTSDPGLASRQRAQLKFSWMLWPTANDLNVTVDHESLTTFRWLYPKFTNMFSWEDASTYCRLNSEKWRLPVVESYWEMRALSMYPNSTAIPINNHRDLASGAFIWSNNNPMKFVDWATNYPTTPVADPTSNCVNMDKTVDNKWKNIACTPKVYPMVTCKTRQWSLIGFTSFVASVEVYPNTRRYDNVFVRKTPKDNTTMMYGMTIFQPARLCRATDFFVFMAGNDRMTVTRNDRCTIYVAGKAQMTEYNQVLRTMTWVGTDNTTRSQIRLGFLYWTDPLIRDLVMDLDSNHVYSSIYSTAQWTPTVTYPFYKANDFCTNIGMFAAEIQSESESVIQHLTTRFGTMILGGSRSVVGPHQWYTSNTQQNFTEWEGTILNSNAVACVYRTSTGYQNESSCSYWHQSIGCEKESWDIWGDVMYAIKRRYVNWTATDGKLNGIDTLDLTWVRDTTIAYGATVQLSVSQCVPTNDTLVMAATPQFGGFTQTYVAAGCALFMSYASPQKSVAYKYLLANTRLQTGVVDILLRPQLQFGWIIWTTAGVNNMLQDLELKRAYMFIDSAAALTYDDALGGLIGCRSKGQYWELPSLNRRYETTLLSMYMNAAVTTLPLYLQRKIAPDLYFAWVTGEPLTFAKWASAKPTSTNANFCAMLRNTGEWEDYGCGVATHKRIACEGPKFDYSGTTTWIVPPEGNPTYIIRNLFAPADFSTVNASMIWGATVMTPVSDCRWLDTFMTEAASDAFSVIYLQDCTMYFGGYASMEEYNHVLNGVQWRAVYPYSYLDGIQRTTLKIGYIYWVNQHFREMGGNLEYNRFYINFPAQTYFQQPSPTYYQTRSDGYCNSFGLMDLEIYSSDDQQEQWRTMSGIGTMWIGMARTGKWSFEWRTTHTSVSVGGWAPLNPANQRFNCMILSATGYWMDVDCRSQQSGVACMAPTYWNWNITSRSLPDFLSLELTNHTWIRILNFDNTKDYIWDGKAHINFDWFPNNLPVYGATIAIAPQHCKSGDVIYTLFSTFGVTEVYKPSVCALYIRGNVSAVQLKNIIRRFGFRVDEIYRTQISFSWVVWTQSNLKDMMVNGETHGVYTFVKHDAMSWVAATATCQSLGLGWNIAEARNREEERIITSFLSTSGYGIAIGLQRREEHEDFRWVSQSPFTYWRWAPRFPIPPPEGLMSPENSTTNCTFIDATDGAWREHIL